MKTEEYDDITHRIYNEIIRPYLPYKISVHNGVAVEDETRLFDFTDTFPEYEEALISGIRSQVRENDSVTVVGGGLGVSTVVAAEATGRRGSVETFEASENQYNIVRNTVRLNKVEEFVNINHEIVGSFSEYSSESYGTASNAEVIDPSSLPDSDVLVLDCEGAEIEILNDLSHYPRAIIVETHGFLGSSEKEVREILLDENYRIVERGIEVESEGVFVLTAIQEK